MKKRMFCLLFLVLLMVCTLTSCGTSGPSGTYKSESNSDISLEFQDGEKVTYSDGENTVEGAYTVLEDKYVVLSFSEEVNWPVLGQSSPASEMAFEIENSKTLVCNMSYTASEVELMTFTKAGFLQTHWKTILIIVVIFGIIGAAYEKITGRSLDDAADDLEKKIDDFMDK